MLNFIKKLQGLQKYKREAFQAIQQRAILTVRSSQFTRDSQELKSRAANTWPRWHAKLRTSARGNRITQKGGNPPIPQYTVKVRGRKRAGLSCISCDMRAFSCTSRISHAALAPNCSPTSAMPYICRKRFPLRDYIHTILSSILPTALQPLSRRAYTYAFTP